MKRLSIALLAAWLWCGNALGQTVVKYVHTDALGSVVALTNAAGGLVEPSTREYEPYGQQLAPAVADGPGYTGHVQDAASGLAYMQQRYYDPQTGRFLSMDPFVARTQGDNFNRYSYANNNPYRFKDPDGRESGPAYRSIYQADSGQSHQRQESGPMAQLAGDALLSIGIDLATGPSGEAIAIFNGIRAARIAENAIDAAQGAANGVRAGKSHTRAANRLGREQNKTANGGQMVCPSCGKKMNDPTQSKRGEGVDRDSAVGDHKHPKSKGGDGATVKDMRNHETKCWECNSKKSDKLP